MDPLSMSHEPSTKVEIRILSFEFSQSSDSNESYQSPKMPRDQKPITEDKKSKKQAQDRLQNAEDELAKLEAELAKIVASYAPAGDGPDFIESTIEGEFNGWEGETIFKLSNGQIWQQVSYAYTYHYSYRPKVFIIKTHGAYKMKVDGVSGTIFVKRLK